VYVYNAQFLESLKSCLPTGGPPADRPNVMVDQFDAE